MLLSILFMWQSMLDYVAEKPPLHRAHKTFHTAPLFKASMYFTQPLLSPNLPLVYVTI